MNWGGQEHRALEQMRWLAANGHEVALAARPGGDVATRAEAWGLTVHPIAFRGNYDPMAMMAARRLVLRNRIDLVDCHGSRDAAAFAFSRGLAAVVRTRHITQPVKNKLRRRLLWRHGSDHIIATAACVRDRLVESGLVPARHVSVVGEWADDPFFDLSRKAAHRAELRREVGIGDGRPLVAVVGMLRDDKGQEHFIHALGRLKGQGRPAVGLVVGAATRSDTAYEQVLHGLTRKLGLEPDVHFLGYRDDVARITQGVDALVVPSLLEAQSRTVPQAFASATPVVATRVGGIPELVTDDETGWLVPPADPAAIAAALTRIFADPAATEEVTERARRFAEGCLRLDARMHETLAVYAAVIQNRRCGNLS